MAETLPQTAADVTVSARRCRESSVAGVLLAVIVIAAAIMETYLPPQTATGPGLAGFSDHVAYFVEATLYDLLFYATLGLLALLAGWKLQPLQRCYVGAVGMLSVLLGVWAVRWGLYRYFKGAFDFGVVWDLAEGRLAGVLAYLDYTAPLAAAGVALYIAVNVFVVRRLRRHGHSVIPATIRIRPIMALGLAWALIVLNHFLVSRHQTLRNELGRKCSFACVDAAVDWCGDLDRDGFGPLSPLPDPDNLDADVHPYAVDKPGNGVDENGLAGDLPQAKCTALPAGLSWPARTDGRNVMLIVVETMRFDLIGLTLGGHEVTPFLNSVAREHCYFTHAYSNYGMTTRAILTLLTGTLDYDDQTETLFDGFRRLGYRTCAVSAQNEEWGRCFARARMHELDDYFDASQASSAGQSLGTWRRLFPATLTVESRTLNRHIFETIERDPSRPFFMYVNYQDLHYPYHLPSMRPVFIEEARCESAFFREHNADLILRQYANAAHHLDASFQELFEYLESRDLLQETVVIIMGDHGDSFYDDGVMGHGWFHSDFQVRVPLLVVNGRGRFTNPVGQDEVAEIILRSVDPDEPSPAAQVIDDPNKRVLLLNSDLARPRQIALRSLGGGVDFDFRTGRVRFDGEPTGLQPATQPLGPKQAERFARLINIWESRCVAHARRTAQSRR